MISRMDRTKYKLVEARRSRVAIKRSNFETFVYAVRGEAPIQVHIEPVEKFGGLYYVLADHSVYATGGGKNGKTYVNASLVRDYIEENN